MVVKNLEVIRSGFCYISTLSHIAFFSGQCGFNMALFVTISNEPPIEYLAFTQWLVFEGFLLTLVSTLLLYGMYKRVHKILLSWLIIVSLCLVLYISGTLCEIFGFSKGDISYFNRLNTGFYYRRIDSIGIVWRLYLLVTMGFIGWLYSDMKKSSVG